MARSNARTGRTSATAELRRVMRMAQKFITGDIYSPGKVNPESLTERQLRNIRSKNDLIRRNIIQWDMEKWQEYQGEKEERRKVKKKLKKAAKKDKTGFYSDPGAPAAVLRIGEQNHASLKSIMEMIQKAIEYDGHLARTGSSGDGYILVNAAGREMMAIFERAIAELGPQRMERRLRESRNVFEIKEISEGMHDDKVIEKYAADEITERLRAEFGSIAEAKRFIKKLLLAVYDDVYAKWAGGDGARQADMARMCRTLGFDYFEML